MTSRGLPSRYRSFRSRRRRILPVLGFVLAAWVSGAQAQVPTTWELTPYRVLVYVTASDDPSLGPDFPRRAAEHIVRRTGMVVGPAWELDAAVAPPPLARAMRSNFEALQFTPPPPPEPRGKESNAKESGAKAGAKEKSAKEGDAGKAADASGKADKSDAKKSEKGPPAAQPDVLKFTFRGEEILSVDVSSGLSQQFTSADNDSDGRVSVAELAENPLAQRDANGDGWLTWGEALPEKILFVCCLASPADCRIKSREFDVATRRWGTPVAIRACQPEVVLEQVFRAATAAFAPLARVTASEGKQVTLSFRAGALPVRDPLLLQANRSQVFLPIVRVNDRDGRPRQVQPRPWMVLTPTSAQGAQVVCEVHSALGGGLGAGQQGRMEQLALAVAPPAASTRLELVSRTDTKRPLLGYDVFSRLPQPPADPAAAPPPPPAPAPASDAAAPSAAAPAPEPPKAPPEKLEFLGRSDRLGEVTIVPGEQPFRWLVIKHGGETMARLPVIPGVEPKLQAPITDDDERLLVEGFITHLQEELIDTVARREMLLVRIRAQLRGKRFDEARRLMDEVKETRTRDEFLNRLEERRRNVVTNDPRVRQRIKKLFDDTKKVLGEQLDPDPVAEVEEDIQIAIKEAEQEAEQPPLRP